jgi:hypothetical protein
VEKVASDILTAVKTIKMVGYVLDENGKALPGTSVVIKGSTVGTVADVEGMFKLEVPENAAIVISFVGKKTFVDSYSGITSGSEKEGVFYKKYKMDDVVIVIGNEVPPPPPPKVKSEDIPPPPPPPSPLKKGEKEQEVFYIVEDMPQYPGGQKALQEYITKMQQKLSQSNGIKGKAKVAFTVNGKGKVSDIKIVEQDNDGVAKGAVSIVSGMEDWSPGKQRGKGVPVKYLLPVEFK